MRVSLCESRIFSPHVDAGKLGYCCGVFFVVLWIKL